MSAGEGGGGSSRSGHLRIWGEGGQSIVDVHIWFKFDKHLISNLSWTAEICQLLTATTQVV